MQRFSTMLAAAALAGTLVVLGQTNRPEFKPAPEVPAMPKTLMKLPRTEISRAKYPAIDFHLHGRQLPTNALKYLPAAREAYQRRLAARP